MLALVESWEAPRDHHPAKTFKFPDFKAALAYVDNVGAMAEQQGHHPDLHIAWGKVTVEIWTTKINGIDRERLRFRVEVRIA